MSVIFLFFEYFYLILHFANGSKDNKVFAARLQSVYCVFVVVVCFTTLICVFGDCLS